MKLIIVTATQQKKETVWFIQADSRIEDHAKHTKRFVQIVRKSAKSLLSPETVVPFTVKNVIRNAKTADVKVVVRDLTDLLKRAFLYRESLKLDTNAMRLVNGRRDGLEGLIIDRFNKHFVVYVLDVGWHAHQKTINDALVGHFEVEYLVFKDRTVSQLTKRVPYCG